MNRSGLFLVFSMILFYRSAIPGFASDYYISASSPFADQDTTGKQILFNGIIWRNPYFHINGDQFLFSDKFLPGTVTISGKLFTHHEFLYDIYSDEVLIKTDNGTVIQLNKEMVNSFTMDFNNKTYDLYLI